MLPNLNVNCNSSWNFMRFGEEKSMYNKMFQVNLSSGRTGSETVISLIKSDKMQWAIKQGGNNI